LKTRLSLLLSFFLLFISCTRQDNNELCPQLQISGNKRYLVTDSGEPFFWLGDTGWLLFTKLTREEAEKYFEDRHQKSFNVIQVMVLHNVLKAVNVYGDSALVNHDIEHPFTTEGNSFEDPDQYDYWDHVDSPAVHLLYQAR